MRFCRSDFSQTILACHFSWVEFCITVVMPISLKALLNGSVPGTVQKYIVIPIYSPCKCLLALQRVLNYIAESLTYLRFLLG